MSIPIDVRDLLGHPGGSRRIDVREPLQDARTEVASVPPDRPVEADLLLESLVEGILATGTVRARVDLTCARCLTPLESELSLDVQELFRPGATSEDDHYPVVEGFVDLDQMLRDAILLAIPFSPLCTPGCLGLCERCGGNRNLGECRCPPEADLRWGALAGLDVPEDEQDDGGDSRHKAGA